MTMNKNDKKNTPGIETHDGKRNTDGFSFEEEHLIEEEVFTPPRVIIRFFIIPLGLVLGVIAIYLGIGWMFGGEKTPADYIKDLSSPYPSTREHALYDLTAYLRQNPDAGKDEELFSAVLDAFRKREKFRREVRVYLALALGYMRNTSALPVLKEGLHDDDPALVFYTIWALGKIGDKKAIPWIIPFLESSDAGLREITVRALGELNATEKAEVLQKRLEDEDPSVRMNACFVLARWNVPEAGDCVLPYLNREYVHELTKGDPQKIRDVLLDALTLSTPHMGKKEYYQAVEKIAQTEKDMKIKNKALRILEDTRP